MSRRDFSILAMTGILGASSSGLTKAMISASKYRKQSFDAMGSSKRRISLGGLNVAVIPHRSIQALTANFSLA